jgi:hypothetical protein
VGPGGRPPLGRRLNGVLGSLHILRYPEPMAQDPEEDEGLVDTSSELDMVTLYRSPSVGSEIEADIIRGILDSHGIPSLLSRAMGYPSLGFQVQVHRHNMREARQLIEEARAAGPAAAMEAERASEEGR